MVRRRPAHYLGTVCVSVDLKKKNKTSEPEIFLSGLIENNKVKDEQNTHRHNNCPQLVGKKTFEHISYERYLAGSV